MTQPIDFMLCTEVLQLPSIVLDESQVAGLKISLGQKEKDLELMATQANDKLQNMAAKQQEALVSLYVHT